MFELSTSYGQYQNGVAESSNRLTEYRCRNMTIAAPHIPDSMWPYASRYAIELLNHTPSQVLDGKTPQQLRLESMGVADPIPNLHSFRSYGETGYVHGEQRQKGAKFDGCAVPMHFVSREGSRIYLMWDPQTRKVNRSSSVAWASHQIAEIPRTQPVQQADDYYRPQPLSIPVLAVDLTSALPPPLAEQTQPSLIQPPSTPP
jgi:hypothetical protein